MFCHTYVMLTGIMVKTGRPTDDPKGVILSIRVAKRDADALRAAARRDGVTVGEAARRAIRKALSIPALPSPRHKATLKKSLRKGRDQ